MTASEPNYFPKASLPNTISLEIGLQHMNLLETQTLSPKYKLTEIINLKRKE